jgi:hypothetical protein
MDFQPAVSDSAAGSLFTLRFATASCFLAGRPLQKKLTVL